MANDQVPSVLLHAMEHTVSGHYNVAHGSGLAALFPAVFSFNLDYCSFRQAKIYDLLVGSRAGLGEREAAWEAIRLICQLIERVDQNYTLRSLGVRKESFLPMSQQALTTMVRGIANNPRPTNLEQLIDLYREVLDEKVI